MNFKTLSPQAPYFMFYDVNLAALASFDEGFSVADFFTEQSTGIISARDDLTVDFDRDELIAKIADFLDPHRDSEETRARYFKKTKTGKYLAGDSRGWKLKDKRPILQKKDSTAAMRRINYRPLDMRWMLYDADIVDWPRAEMMAHFNDGENVALLTPRMTADDFSPLVSDAIISNKTASRYDQSYFFPLYLYPTEADLDQNRRVNLDPKLYSRLQKLVSKSERGVPTELEVFDYIYGVLHCPAYRATYAEFLKIDFPRIPWPINPSEFWDVSDKGGLLRQLHLLEPKAIGDTPFPFKGDGDTKVDAPRFEDGKVWINETQYFDNASEISWEFYIGGYQPAQKWLKDRANRQMTFDDVKHYQRILKVLSETDRIMHTITMTLDANG